MSSHLLGHGDLMKSNIQGVYKNIRYRILSINGQGYLIDLDRPIWVILFPFAYWFLGHSAYKIDDDAIKKIKTPDVEQVNATPLIIFGTGLAILISNLINPLMDYFNISSSSTTNSVIIVSLLLIALILRLIFMNINKRNLDKVVNVESLSEEKIKITPKSSSHILKFVALYAFIAFFTILIGLALISDGNIMILFIFFVLLSGLLQANILTVALQRDYKVELVQRNQE